jgi:SH3-like domain-containing protein
VFEGWVYFRLLSGKRTIIISQDEIFLRKTSKKNSNPIGILKYGVIGELIDKKGNSCNAKFQNLKGWINKNDAWGC